VGSFFGWGYLFSVQAPRPSTANMGKRMKIKSIVGSPCGVLLHLINANRKASAVYCVYVFAFFDVLFVEDI
jgi:hypothetical protein